MPSAVFSIERKRMTEWNIQPRASACAVCNAPFLPGNAGHSLLSHTDGEWRRQDFCPACFEALPSDVVQSAVSAWSFSVPKATKSKTREEPLHKETAEHLLRTLMARGDPNDRGTIYVLAVLMERSKRFVERDVTVDAAGRRIRLYEQRGTGDLFPVVDPELRVEDIATVQKRMLDLLEGGAQALRPRAKVIRQRRPWRTFRVLRRRRK